MSADILLTGARGQLGCELARRAGATVVKAFGRDELDVTNIDSVQRAFDACAPKIVVSAGAYTAVDKAETDAEAAFAVNRDGPAHLAAACLRAHIPLVHISTDYVFDGTKAGPYVEDDPVAPLGVYGASKLAGEEAIRGSGVKHVILRTAWVYGVEGANFVKTMLRLARERDVVWVVDDQRGCPTFAGDLAEAVLAISRQFISQPSATNGGTFHCAGEGPTTWCAFARRIFEAAGPRLGKRPRVEAISTAEYPTPARRPANSVLDCGKLKRVYGLALRSWPEALEEMLHVVLAQ